MARMARIIPNEEMETMLRKLLFCNWFGLYVSMYLFG